MTSLMDLLEEERKRKHGRTGEMSFSFLGS